MAKQKKERRYIICPASHVLHDGPVACPVKWGRNGWPHFRCAACGARGFLPKGVWEKAHGLTKAQAQESGAFVTLN